MTRKTEGSKPQDLAHALAQAGSTMLLANRDLGYAVALTDNGDGYSHQTHCFSTDRAFKANGALTRQAWKEIQGAGLIPGLVCGNTSAATRLMARGAIAAALSGTLFLGLGATDAQAGLGYTYFGGGNPLAEVWEPLPKPAFVDIDKDGDLDCFVGEGSGGIVLWENTSSNGNVSFARVEHELNPLSSVQELEWAAPTFVDIDGDGDMDAFIGHDDYLYQPGFDGNRSSVSFAENVGTPTNPVFNWNGVITDTRKAALDYNPLVVNADDQAAPTFADIDGDGDMDAFVGGEDGYIYGYENVTGETPQKNGVTRIEFQSRGPLGYTAGYNYTYIEAYGNAVPFFADIDGDGDLDLFVGNQYGPIMYFENVGTKTNFEFVQRSRCAHPFKVNPGNYSAPAIVDINGDGVLDAFAGATWFVEDRPRKDMPSFLTSLSVRYYPNVGTTTEPDLRSRGDNPFNLGPKPILPNPSLGDVDGDGDLDAFIGAFSIWSTIDNKNADRKDFKGSLTSPLNFYENVGTANDPVFSALNGEPNPWTQEGPGNLRDKKPNEDFLDWFLPAAGVADLDGDGMAEVYVGYTENLGYDNNNQKLITKGDPLSPTGVIEAYQFITDTREFDQLKNNPFEELDMPVIPSPSFADIDGDGDLDAFVGGYLDYGQAYHGSVSFFLNEGTPLTPSFTLVQGEGNPFSDTLVLGPAKVDFADIDGDGDLDAVLGSTLYALGRKNGDDPPPFGVRYFQNVGNITTPEFVEREGAGNPFDAVNQDVFGAVPALGDLDGDKDVDAIFGDFFGKIYYYRAIMDEDEVAGIIQDHGWELCFVESAKPEASMWNSIVDSCKQGVQKVKAFF